MRNAAFLIWMFGWPVIAIMQQFVVQYLCGISPTTHTTTYAGPIEELFMGGSYLGMLSFYFFVAYKLYDPPTEKSES